MYITSIAVILHHLLIIMQNSSVKFPVKKYIILRGTTEKYAMKSKTNNQKLDIMNLATQ